MNATSQNYEATIRTMYRSMVNDMGGVDAAAAVLRMAPASISRQCNGGQAIGLHHIWALEDALGHYPVSRFRGGHLSRSDGECDMAILSMRTLREVGDVGPALIALLEHGDDAAAVKEMREAVAALTEQISAVEARTEAV